MTEIAAASGIKTLVPPSSVTMTIASPCVCTCNGHGLFANDMVSFATTGNFPTGITAGVSYFALASGLDANNFQISATKGGAAINTSEGQSGTHTLTTEYVLSEQTTAGIYQLALDLAALAGADLVLTQIYDLIDGTNPRRVWYGYAQGVQALAGKASWPIGATVGVKFTLKALAGAGRAIPWELRRA